MCSNMIGVRLFSFITFLYVTNCEVLPQTLIRSVLNVVGYALSKVPHKTHPDWGLNEHQMCYRYGYVLEEHQVVTEDGYMLRMFRIPYGKDESSELKERPPVLIMHGLSLNSMNWINSGNESLGFRFADAGYDVWLGNFRSAPPSLNHVTLNLENDKRYWDFSIDELGLYDLPAMIDYILDYCSQQQILYIGHSMGSSSLAVMFDTRPEYVKKVKAVAMLGPVIYLDLAPSNKILFYLVASLSRFGIFGGPQNTVLLRQILRLICSSGSRFQSLCMVIISLVSGVSDYLNRDRAPVIMTPFLSGASVKQYQHHIQLQETGEFRHFDHGPQENLQRYGSTYAPKIDLSKTKVPVAVFYGDTDALYTEKTIQRLAAELPNVVILKKLGPNFSHLDFFGGVAIGELITDPLNNFFREF